MSGGLPTLPQAEAGAAVSANDVLRWETQVVSAVTAVDDVAQLDEWRSKAGALETYLRGKDMQRPMLGAQRRIEGRIGQLLGKPEKGGRGKTSEHDPRLRDYLPEFRLIARALSGDCELTDDEWRKSRRALVSLIRNRLDLMPETPALPDGDTPAAWCVWHRTRIQHHKSLGRDGDLAGALAWGEAENIWHQRHGAKLDPSNCAGCGGLLSGRERLTLGDGAALHWDDAAGLDCLGTYGRRWRAEVSAGLVVLGLEPPGIIQGML